MLVIHPEDRTTAMLSKLYSGLDGVRHIGKSVSNAEVRHILNHTSSDELIMMLGMGRIKGCFHVWTTLRIVLTELLSDTAMPIICIIILDVLSVYGVMLTFSHVRRVCMACFPV